MYFKLGNCGSSNCCHMQIPVRTSSVKIFYSGSNVLLFKDSSSRQWFILDKSIYLLQQTLIYKVLLESRAFIIRLEHSFHNVLVYCEISKKRWRNSFLLKFLPNVLIRLGVGIHTDVVCIKHAVWQWINMNGYLWLYYDSQKAIFIARYLNNFLYY